MKGVKLTLIGLNTVHQNAHYEKQKMVKKKQNKKKTQQQIFNINCSHTFQKI